MRWDSIDNLKRRVRKLKHFEKTIRSQNGLENSISLVWDKFFNLKDNGNCKSLYPLTKLISMSRDEYKTVVDAFFARVYYEIYAYIGISDEIIFDTELLSQLNLSPVADETAIKKRFRELAKEYHPDVGGDAIKFISLMQIYRKLIEK
jgi:DnaJ-domain-containing protein 1